MKEKSNHLKFFGIGKVLPFLKKVRGMILCMVILGLISSGVDVIMPLFQRYALNYFIGEGTFDTLPFFILLRSCIHPLTTCGSTASTPFFAKTGAGH